MAVNIPGIIAVAVFYIAILLLGIIVGRKTNKNSTNEAVLVADRSLGYFVSIFTITATNIGGGYILGSAESAASVGVIQTVAPLGYCISFIFSGCFYAPKIRREGYITVFDPFQLKYGKKLGAILFIPQLLGDLFWGLQFLQLWPFVAYLLTSPRTNMSSESSGSTISILLDINSTLSIVISAAVAIIYTVFGGLYAVAYTDVIQLFFIFFGLVLTFPFCLVHPAVDLSRVSNTWIGEIPISTIGSYIDVCLLCIMGGIPWQALYQRVLACRDVRVAWVSTLTSGFLCLLLGIPPIIMGIAGAATDWNATDYPGPIPIPDSMTRYILPLTLHYLTPVPVAIVGIGAVAAAVMSSCDSTIMSSSSVFSKNVYRDIFRPKASDREMMWVLRISIIVIGALSTLIAIFSTTIYGLFVLCSDLMYVVLFPQLTLVLWMPQTNGYGSLAGFLTSLIVRILSGEPVLHLSPVIKFPFFDEVTQLQHFPHRTFAMLVGTVLIVLVSIATNVIFMKGILSHKYDVLKCYKQKTHKLRHSHDNVKNGVSNMQAMPLTNYKL